MLNPPAVTLTTFSTSNATPSRMSHSCSTPPGSLFADKVSQHDLSERASGPGIDIGQDQDEGH